MADRQLPAGPGRPGRAAGWRPREAAGEYNLVDFMRNIENLIANDADVAFTGSSKRFKASVAHWWKSARLSTGSPVRRAADGRVGVITKGR